MKRFATILATLFTAAVLIGVAAPANADELHFTANPIFYPMHNTCVTHKEYRRVQVGMPRWKVERILKGSGDVTGDLLAYHTATYKNCGWTWSFVGTAVHYDATNHVTRKNLYMR